MLKKFFKFNILLLGLSCAAHPLYARDVNFEASVNSNIISIGESARLALTFYGTQDVPAPDIKDLEGFQVRYVGPSKVMSIVNGKVSNSVTHNYTLLPLRVGSFELGPLSFEYKGDRYISNKIQIKVVEGAREKEDGAIPAGAKPDLSSRIFLTMSVDRTEAYINELIPLTIKLYISRLSVRDIQFPVFAQEGFSKAEFNEPRQYREALAGTVYDVIEFNTHIFGTKTGGYKVGPAEVSCNLVMRKSGRRTRTPFEEDFFGGGADDSLFDDFFTRYERYPLTLKSKDAALKILPLPKEGAPKDFTGTIGDFQFVLGVNPKEVTAGDPITLRMTIYGSGNFNTVTPPRMEAAAGLKVYEPQVRTEDNHKVFEQVVIPENENVKELPRIKFSFFNPTRSIYETITHGPIPITVQKAPEGSRQKIVELPSGSAAKRDGEARESVGRDIIYIKEGLGPLKARAAPLYKNKVFLFLQLLPFLALSALFIVSSRRERLKKDIRYARLLRAPKIASSGIRDSRRFLKSNNVEDFYDTVFTTLRNYLGHRFYLPTGGITVHIIDDVLRPRGFNEDALKKLEGLFEDCDLARYAPSGMDASKMKSSLKRLEEVITYFERARI